MTTTWKQGSLARASFHSLVTLSGKAAYLSASSPAASADQLRQHHVAAIVDDAGITVRGVNRWRNEITFEYTSIRNTPP